MSAQHQFGSSFHEPGAVSTIKFEIKSFIGRLFSRGNRIPDYSLLHLGCGPNLINGFENMDFYSMRFWKAKYIGHDLRHPLPYKDKTFDGVFSEHTLEHLYASDAINLLREVHRILKPGSVFRIVVPDLKKYVDFYEGKNLDPEFQKFTNGCEGIWCLTQNWGHLSCWDAEMLSKKLVEAGFKTAAEVSFLTGADKRLLCDLEARKWESLYIEAIA